MSHHSRQLPCAAVGTSPSIGFQTAYSISKHNISTSRKQRIPRVPRYAKNAGKHARMLVCTHGIPNITSQSIFIYRCRSRTRYLLCIIKYPRGLLSRTLQKFRGHIYFSESYRDKTTANMYSKYSYR